MTKWSFSGSENWMKEKTIAWRELFAVLITVATFGPYLKNRDLVMNIDNEAIQQSVQNGKSKQPDLMALIRALYFYTSIYNITYTTVHVKSAENPLADAISRDREDIFRQLAPISDICMTPPRNVILDF